MLWQAADPYTRKLVGSFPNLHGDRRTLDVITGQPPDLLAPPPGCRFAPRCEFAMPVCTEVVPPEVRFSDGVRVACHLYPTSDVAEVAAAVAPAPPLAAPAMPGTSAPTPPLQPPSA